MDNINIKSFLIGCFLTALILIPLFYFYFLPHHYQGLKADIDANKESIVEILKHDPYFRENVYWLIRGMDGFEDQMNEREKMILTRDMPSKKIEVKPSEED